VSSFFCSFPFWYIYIISYFLYKNNRDGMPRERSERLAERKKEPGERKDAAWEKIGRNGEGNRVGWRESML
jgi:hypothetical protein